MLRRIGIGLVTTVESGSRALQVLQEGDYDIVISDVQMPEMDGMELSEAILKSSALPKIPLIIGLTADTSLSVEERCLASGMADVIHKVRCYGMSSRVRVFPRTAHVHYLLITSLHNVAYNSCRNG